MAEENENFLEIIVACTDLKSLFDSQEENISKSIRAAHSISYTEIISDYLKIVPEEIREDFERRYEINLYELRQSCQASLSHFSKYLKKLAEKNSNDRAPIYEISKSLEEMAQELGDSEDSEEPDDSDDSDGLD